MVARVLQKLLASQSKMKLKAALDSLRDGFFAEAPESERHHNRVTLFRPDRARRFLRPFCRSGTQYQRCNTSFAIDDNNEQANEGVAGRAWFSDATITKELPAVPNPWRDKNEDCFAYAEAGFLHQRRQAA